MKFNLRIGSGKATIANCAEREQGEVSNSPMLIELDEVALSCVSGGGGIEGESQNSGHKQWIGS